MKNIIQIFKNPAFGEVRTLTKEDKSVWFVGKDVAAVLGYRDTPKAIKAHVDDEDKVVGDLPTSFGVKPTTFINESGLYALVLASKLPQAKAFKRWVTSEVLPSIRKEGGYIATKADDTPEEIMARALLIAKSTINRLEQENKCLSLKAEHLDKVLLCDQCYTTTQIAKELDMSVHELYDKLLEKHILYRQSRQYMLYAEYARLGLAKNRTAEEDMRDGTIKVFRPYLVWTEKGRIFIHNLMNQNMSHVTSRTALLLIQPSLFSTI